LQRKITKKEGKKLPEKYQELKRQRLMVEQRAGQQEDEIMQMKEKG